jgi:hypothetical protein
MIVPAALEACAALSDLAGWPPVGALVETARTALRGDGGLSAFEGERLRRWADRWRRLDPRLRAVYAAFAPVHETASVCLWRILEGGAPVAGWQRGRMEAIWREVYGFCAPIDVVPWTGYPEAGKEEAGAGRRGGPK